MRKRRVPSLREFFVPPANYREDRIIQPVLRRQPTPARVREREKLSYIYSTKAISLLMRGGYGRGDLQGALADRVVFSGFETVTACENVCGDFRQCLEDAALDGADRHAAGEIPATAIDVRLVPFESGGTSAAAIVCLP
jgi:hypothetical protein